MMAMETKSVQICSDANGPWEQCFTGVQLRGAHKLGALALVYDIKDFGTGFFNPVAVSKASMTDCVVRANPNELAAVVSVINSSGYLEDVGLTVSFLGHYRKGFVCEDAQRTAKLWRAAMRHMETRMNHALSVAKSNMFVAVRDGPLEFPVQTVQIWACERVSLANVWRLVCKEPPWWVI